MTKKVISVLLSVVMILSVIPMGMFMASAEDSDVKTGEFTIDSSWGRKYLQGFVFAGGTVLKASKSVNAFEIGDVQVSSFNEAGTYTLPTDYDLYQCVAFQQDYSDNWYNNKLRARFVGLDKVIFSVGEHVSMEYTGVASYQGNKYAYIGDASSLKFWSDNQTFSDTAHAKFKPNPDEDYEIISVTMGTKILLPDSNGWYSIDGYTKGTTVTVKSQKLSCDVYDFTSDGLTHKKGDTVSTEHFDITFDVNFPDEVYFRSNGAPNRLNMTIKAKNNEVITKVYAVGDPNFTRTVYGNFNGQISKTATVSVINKDVFISNIQKREIVLNDMDNGQSEFDKIKIYYKSSESVSSELPNLTRGAKIIMGKDCFDRPIEWTVAAGLYGGMFAPEGCVPLISSNILGNYSFSSTYDSTSDYSVSYLRKVIEECVDFNYDEKQAIVPRTIEGGASADVLDVTCDAVLGADVSAYLWAPTAKDASDLEYVDLLLTENADPYWLCSPGGEGNSNYPYAAWAGFFKEYGIHGDFLFENKGYRPAMYLDLSKVSGMKAVEGKKNTYTLEFTDPNAPVAPATPAIPEVLKNKIISANVYPDGTKDGYYTTPIESIWLWFDVDRADSVIRPDGDRSIVVFPNEWTFLSDDGEVCKFADYTRRETMDVEYDKDGNITGGTVTHNLITYKFYSADDFFDEEEYNKLNKEEKKYYEAGLKSYSSKQVSNIPSKFTDSEWSGTFFDYYDSGNTYRRPPFTWEIGQISSQMTLKGAFAGSYRLLYTGSLQGNPTSLTFNEYKVGHYVHSDLEKINVKDVYFDERTVEGINNWVTRKNDYNIGSVKRIEELPEGDYIRVPYEFENWSAGSFINSNSFADAKNEIDSFYPECGFDKTEWTSADASYLSELVGWQNKDGAYSKYAGTVGRTGLVAGVMTECEDSYAAKPYISVLLCEDVNMAEGTKWAILVKDAVYNDNPEYTKDDIYMCGIFGEGDIHVDLNILIGNFITVPEEFKNWTVGYFSMNTSYENLTAASVQIANSYYLGTEYFDASRLKGNLNWQNAAVSKYIDKINSKCVSVAQNTSYESYYSSSPYIAIILSEDGEFATGSKWAVLAKDMTWMENPTYTRDDILLSGIVGQKGTDLEVLPGIPELSKFTAWDMINKDPEDGSHTFLWVYEDTVKSAIKLESDVVFNNWKLVSAVGSVCTFSDGKETLKIQYNEKGEIVGGIITHGESSWTLGEVNKKIDPVPTSLRTTVWEGKMYDKLEVSADTPDFSVEFDTLSAKFTFGDATYDMMIIENTGTSLSFGVPGLYTLKVTLNDKNEVTEVEFFDEAKTFDWISSEVKMKINIPDKGSYTGKLIYIDPEYGGEYKFSIVENEDDTALLTFTEYGTKLYGTLNKEKSASFTSGTDKATFEANELPKFKPSLKGYTIDHVNYYDTEYYHNPRSYLVVYLTTGEVGVYADLSDYPYVWTNAVLQGTTYTGEANLSTKDYFYNFTAVEGTDQASFSLDDLGYQFIADYNAELSALYLGDAGKSQTKESTFPYFIPSLKDYDYTKSSVYMGECNGKQAYIMFFHLDTENNDVAILAYLLDTILFWTSVPGHTHEFTFAAEGNVITAKCSDETCALYTTPATLTLSAEGGAYNNSAYTAQTDNGTTGFTTTTKSTLGDIVYYLSDGSTLTYAGTDNAGKAPVNVGTYVAKATVTYGTDSTVTAVKSFTISKADPVVSGTALKAEVSYGAAVSASDIVGSMNTQGTFAWKNTVTSYGDVGEKTLTAVFTPTDTTNYNSVEVNVAVKVAKIDYTGTTTDTTTINAAAESTTSVVLADLPAGASYGTPAVSGVSGVTAAKETVSEKLTVKLTVNTEIGVGTTSFTVTIPVTGATNYKNYDYVITVTPVYHTHVKGTSHAAKNATCTEKGNVLYYDCTGCEKKLDADGKEIAVIEIAALGHNFNGDYVQGTGENANKHARKCERFGTCGALGNMINTVATEGYVACSGGGTATCTAKAVCTACKAEYGDKLAHSFTTYTSDNNATCLADGTKTAKCDNCTATDTVTDTGSKKDHSYTGEVKANNDGTHEFKCVNGCDNYGGTVNCSGGTATCTAKAVCTACKAEYGDKLAHSFTTYTSDNNATCIADGTKTAKCNNCTATDTVTDTGSKKDHSYTGEVKANNDGTHEFKCVNGCDNYGGKADCSGGTATCTKKAVCTSCKAEYGDKLAHSFTNYVSDNNATCLADGTKTAKCNNCTETDTVTDTGSKKDHSYTGAYVDNGNGTHSRKCVNGCNAYGTPTAHTGMEDFICDDCGYTDKSAQLEKAKQTAIDEINRAIPENASEEVMKAATEAIERIIHAETLVDVNEIKTAAIDEIAGGSGVASFRCPLCQRYEEEKDVPFYGFILSIVHLFIHMVYSIGRIT